MFEVLLVSEFVIAKVGQSEKFKDFARAVFTAGGKIQLLGASQSHGHDIIGTGTRYCITQYRESELFCRVHIRINYSDSGPTIGLFRNCHKNVPT